MMKLRDKIVLTESIHRYPDFIAEKGLTGTVTEVSDEGFWVQMDEPLLGAEEWDNSVEFDYERFADEWVVQITG